MALMEHIYAIKSVKFDDKFYSHFMSFVLWHWFLDCDIESLNFAQVFLSGLNGTYLRHKTRSRQIFKISVCYSQLCLLVILFITYWTLRMSQILHIFINVALIEHLCRIRRKIWCQILFAIYAFCNISSWIIGLSECVKFWR